MEREDFYINQENNEGFIKKGPLTKALSGGSISETDLPFEIKTNPELLRQCKEREATIKGLDDLYTKIPTLTTIDTALEKDLVTLDEAHEFYTSIIHLIENDEQSKRVLLYFPIELLPHQTNKKLEFFRTFYKNTWKELLKEIDVREGFNSGDIPEEELRNGPLAKVSKAAHLIPSLLEKGIVSKDEVFHILENENDETITEGILDTLRILADKKYIDDSDLDELEKSKKIGVKNMVKMIRRDQDSTKEDQTSKEQKMVDVEEIFNSMNLEMNGIESSLGETASLTKARLKWLMDIEKEKILEKYSELIYKKINDNEVTIERLLEDKDQTEEQSVVLIKSLEKLLLKNPTDNNLSAALAEFKKSPNIHIKNTLLNTVHRFHTAGMLNEKYFSNNELEKEETAIEKSVEQKIKNVISKIETDPLLADSVYPAAILYGSHIKGYGKENSDTDIGVFIKETVSFDKHEEIKSTFNNILDDLHINGSVMEFWLTNKENSLWIQDFENPDNSLGDSVMTSPLTGVWYGEEKTIQTLQADLVPEYLYSEHRQLFGLDARKVWLKDMERNLIQYRLLHKGYQEKNLPQGGIESAYKHEIDGESMFYDSGFRRLATKIYLEKVFLPQLKKV